jgi:hypothetical protein
MDEIGQLLLNYFLHKAFSTATSSSIATAHLAARLRSIFQRLICQSPSTLSEKE